MAAIKHGYDKRFHGEASRRDPAAVPEMVKMALRQAMTAEKIPVMQYQDLPGIMAQESSGRVDARNTHCTARGLFQRLRNNYDLNPNGIKSFGNAIEECQGAAP